jgi:hypothetical protein
MSPCFAVFANAFSEKIFFHKAPFARARTEKSYIIQPGNDAVNVQTKRHIKYDTFSGKNSVNTSYINPGQLLSPLCQPCFKPTSFNSRESEGIRY